MSGADIAERLDMDRNGALSDRLRELAEGGFIDSDPSLNPETGKESRVSRYRLRDNYTRFYLKYIGPRKEMIKRGSYRFAEAQRSVNNPSRSSARIVSNRIFRNKWGNSFSEISRFGGFPYGVHIFARMSGMLDLSRDEKAKHFLPR